MYHSPGSAKLPSSLWPLLAHWPASQETSQLVTFLEEVGGGCFGSKHAGLLCLIVWPPVSHCVAFKALLCQEQRGIDRNHLVSTKVSSVSPLPEQGRRSHSHSLVPLAAKSQLLLQPHFSTRVSREAMVHVFSQHNTPNMFTALKNGCVCLGEWHTGTDYGFEASFEYWLSRSNASKNLPPLHIV